MTKNKVLFIIPDGVGIRNYLYSDLLHQLKEAEITFLSPLPKKAFQELKVDFTYFHLTFSKESFLTRIARETATFARLCYNAEKVKNPSILENWNYEPKGIKLKFLNKTAQLFGKVASKKYTYILKLENFAQKHWSNQVIEQYKKQLLQINPKAVFVTHQRVASLMPICIAAKQLNIPVIAAIYSWDNLPKGRLAIIADKYVVWSDYMRDEMQLFYPEIPLENIIVTGTPQFEFYLQQDKIIERESFAKQHGLDVNRPWICFSGDDIKTSPYDPQYLNDLAQAVVEIEERNRPQIIFRRSPVDFSIRYDEVINQFRDSIKPIDPLWNVPEANGNWGTFFPKKEDIILQFNLGYHCELVVNLGSTMAHDFAIFNKPCCYFNYDPVQNENWSVKTIYNFQHFRSMEGLEAVGWFNSKTDIKNKIETLLSEKTTMGKDRKLWLEKIVLHPVNEASANIAKLLKGYNG